MSLGTFAQQCVAWVEQVFAPIGFKPTGPATAAQYATDPASTSGSLRNQGWTPASTLHSGEIIVEQPGTGGVGSAGHIVAVGGVTPTGGALISQANSLGLGGPGAPPGVPGGGGSVPTLGQLSPTQLDAGIRSGGLSVWEAPVAQQQQAALLAEAAYAQLGGSGAPGNAPLALPATLTSAPASGGAATTVSWWNPLTWGNPLSGAASALGTAAGAGAGAAAGAVVTGTSAAVQGTVIKPTVSWFQRQAVPLTVGVIVWMILVGGPQKLTEQIQLPSLPSQPDPAPAPPPAPAAPAPASTDPWIARQQQLQRSSAQTAAMHKAGAAKAGSLEDLVVVA